VAKTGLYDMANLAFFTPFHKCRFCLFAKVVFWSFGTALGTAKTFPVKDDLVSPMPEAIDGGGPEEFVWEGFAPLAQIQIAGNDGGSSFVAF